MAGQLFRVLSRLSQYSAFQLFGLFFPGSPIPDQCDCIYDMKRGTRHQDHYSTLFKEWHRIFYVQCPIERALHTRPLMTLLGAQGYSQTPGDQIQISVLLLYDLSWTQHQPGTKPIAPLGQCWVPPIIAFYNQQELLGVYSPPGSSTRSPHPWTPNGQLLLISPL